ncbi:hypothetical protein HPP92_003158 [Vanilla planifolia]|uniref:MATH domain-containing protein n=1 Tax=Vanilla planifolia TaxID=51239 RepID=A0A835SB89_VANPL|nr:hypothetical protein HPP92_003158 [Vanilla planifolia]
MWFSKLLSRRGRKEQNFYPTSLSASASPYPYGENPKMFGGSEPSSSVFQSNGYPVSKKEKLPGYVSDDFNVKDSSAYDFLWTIKSFSKLSASSESKLLTGRFDAKGFLWKMVFYPNGNIVNGQISLYLMLSKAASHPTETVFKISYELFLFDQNTGTTLSHKGENFAQVEDELGLRSFLDLKTFKDSEKGYLVNDSCVLGVKILHVVPIQTPTECLHPVEKVNHEYTWKIENFSKLDKKAVHEKKFTAGDYLWCIAFYPEGDSKSDAKVKGNNVSLYLAYFGPITDTSARKVSAEFTLCIIDQIGGNHKKKTYTEVFKSCHPGWGRKDFILLEDFHDPERGFIVNDTCIIEAKVAVIALVK